MNIQTFFFPSRALASLHQNHNTMPISEMGSIASETRPKWEEAELGAMIKIHCKSQHWGYSIARSADCLL